MHIYVCTEIYIWCSCLQWFYAVIPQLNKRPSTNYIHTSSETAFCLYIWMCACMWDMCVHKCVGNTFMGTHACACSAQRVVFAVFFCPIPWFLRQDLPLEPELTNCLDLLARELMGCHHRLPVRDYRQGLHMAFYTDAGDGNLGLYACTTNILTTPSPKTLNCF